MSMASRAIWRATICRTGTGEHATGAGRTRQEAFNRAVREMRQRGPDVLPPDVAETARRLFSGLRGDRLGWREACREDGARTCSVTLARAVQSGAR